MILSDLSINLLMETHSEKIKQKKELAEMMGHLWREERERLGFKDKSFVSIFSLLEAKNMSF